MAPEITSSTKEEREAYIQEHFKCRADCENCGLCKIYRGTSPEIVYQPYIEGEMSFQEVTNNYH